MQIILGGTCCTAHEKLNFPALPAVHLHFLKNHLFKYCKKAIFTLKIFFIQTDNGLFLMFSVVLLRCLYNDYLYCCLLLLS